MTNSLGSQPAFNKEQDRFHLEEPPLDKGTNSPCTEMVLFQPPSDSSAELVSLSQREVQKLDPLSWPGENKPFNAPPFQPFPHLREPSTQKSEWPNLFSFGPARVAQGLFYPWQTKNEPTPANDESIDPPDTSSGPATIIEPSTAMNNEPIDPPSNIEQPDESKSSALADPLEQGNRPIDNSVPSTPRLLSGLAISTISGMFYFFKWASKTTFRTISHLACSYSPVQNILTSSALYSIYQWIKPSRKKQRSSMEDRGICVNPNISVSITLQQGSSDPQKNSVTIDTNNKPQPENKSAESVPVEKKI